MLTPRRRSARLASASAAKPRTAPGLDSVSEYAEPLQSTPRVSRVAGRSSPFEQPSTPASSALKPPHDVMHPSKIHQTTAQPSSALRLGFTDINSSANDTASGIRAPGTPSKVGVPNSSFTFRFTREGGETELSSNAQRLMEELREQAAKIKADLVAQRETDEELQDRKIAKPKGKSSRYSAVHLAEFKKMDSIENHASAWRAQNGRFTPVVSKLKRSPSKADLDTTPTSQVKPSLKRSPSKAELDGTPSSQMKFSLRRSPSKPEIDNMPATPRMKPALKRKSSRANLDEYQQSPSPKKTAPFPTVSKPLLFPTLDQRAPSKRFKQRLEDDASSARPVSRDGTSIPRPKSSGLGSNKLQAPTGGLGRLLSPTKASLAHTAAQGKPTVSLVKSPSKSDLGKPLTKSQSMQSLKTAPAPAPSASTLTPRARVISPGRFERVKSILRGHRTASGNVQTAIPQPATSQTPAPPRIEKALPPVPLTTPRRKLTKHVAFTPEVIRMDTEQNSPSPQKFVSKFKFGRKAAEPQFAGLDETLAGAKTGDVTYPDLSGFRPLPEPPAVEAKVQVPSVPGGFTFRSDHTIKFGGASPAGFGGEAGQSSVRQVRGSIKPAPVGDMPGSFPAPASPSTHPNKENKVPRPGKILFGPPHGMSNKKRHRATWDEEEAEADDGERAAKKRKNDHMADGQVLLAPRLAASTPKRSAKKPQMTRATPGTPASASPKKRGGLSMSRLNMLARPKNRA